MLAAQHEPQHPLYFPLIVSPKIDGVRCLTVEMPAGDNLCVPISRNLKRIRNEDIYARVGKYCPPGLDGELIKGKDLPGPNFFESNALVCCYEAKGDWSYHIFDYAVQDGPWKDKRWHKGILTKYVERLDRLQSLDLPSFCKVVPTKVVMNMEEFTKAYDEYVEQGFEGICARTPHSPYKFGRSTTKEQWLIKFKPTVDEIGEIVGAEEFMHNANEVVDPNSPFGKYRTMHKEGLVPMNKLGALVVRWNGQEFRVGTGFGMAQRDELWAIRDQLVGRKIKFKYQKFGTKDKPRCPAFIEFVE